MPLLVLGILVLWTIAVFRLLGFRTTLGPRTLLTFGALGALLGTVGTPLVEKFFNSYRYEGNQLYVVLIIAVQHFVMATPVLILLMNPVWRRATSLCDALLAAFAIGAGYEFLGALMALAGMQNVPGNLGFLPPATASTATVTVAGYAYWNALAALACAAAFRFLRKPIWVSVITVVALLISTLDHYADLANSPAAQRIIVFTLHGSLVPWLVIVLLIAGVFLEISWTKSKSSARDAIAEFQAVAAALVTFKWNAAKLAGARYHLGRQVEILAAELQREPDNAGLQKQAESIKASLARLAAITPAPSTSVVAWLKLRWPQLLAVIAFLFLGVFLSLPNMGGFPTWIWTSLPLATRYAPFQLTLVITFLMAILLWQFVRRPPQPFSQGIADEAAQFSAELRILQVGFGIVLVGILYPHPAEFTAFDSTLVRGANLRIPGFNEMQMLTLLVLLACAVSALTTRRAERWQRIAGRTFLPTLARNVISMCSITTVAWLSFVFFTEAQIWGHAKLGVKFFNIFRTNGNSILEMVLGVLTAGFSVAVALLVWRAETRFEKTLLPADTGASPPSASGAASAGKGQ